MLELNTSATATTWSRARTNAGSSTRCIIRRRNNF